MYDIIILQRDNVSIKKYFVPKAVNIMRFRSSFILGYGRVLDLFGTFKMYPDIYNSEKKDYEALRSDWLNAEQSFRKEIDRNTA